MYSGEIYFLKSNGNSLVRINSYKKQHRDLNVSISDKSDNKSGRETQREWKGEESQEHASMNPQARPASAKWGHWKLLELHSPRDQREPLVPAGPLSRPWRLHLPRVSWAQKLHIQALDIALEKSLALRVSAYPPSPTPSMPQQAATWCR